MVIFGSAGLSFQIKHARTVVEVSNEKFNKEQSKNSDYYDVVLCFLKWYMYGCPYRYVIFKNNSNIYKLWNITNCAKQKFQKVLHFELLEFLKIFGFIFLAKFRKEFQAVLRLSKCKCTSQKIRVPSVLTSSKNKSSLPRTQGYEMNTGNSKQSSIKSSSTLRTEQNPQEKYGWKSDTQPRFLSTVKLDQASADYNDGWT